MSLLALQLIALAAAGVLLFFLARMDFVSNFYSAHRNVDSVHKLLLPAAGLSAAAGFILVAFVTWIGFRSCTGKLIGPVQRTETQLRRLATGDLRDAPALVPDRQRSTLDDSTEEMIKTFRGKLLEVQRLNKEIHKAVLSLRYKATSDERLTLKELREATTSLDGLSKQLTSSIKWFET